MASSQDWRSALPELSQEWTPQPAPTSLGSMPEQVDFGSVVLSDTLQIRPAIARQGTIQESVPGTMVIHNSRDQDPENPLAWAAKGAATNLLHSQQSTYQEPQDAKQQRKNNLQSLFEPPTPAQPESSPHHSYTPAEMYQTPVYARQTQTDTAIKVSQQPPMALRTPAPMETPRPSSSQFTFSCPRDRGSWKSLKHFNSADESPEGTPRHSTPPVDATSRPAEQRKPSPLKFQYDTHTRNQLEALADEFEGLTFATAAQQVTPRRQTQPMWKEGSPQALPHTEDEDRPIGRSAKRLRLSPEAAFAGTIPATPRSAVRDRIRARRAITADNHTAYNSQTPAPTRVQVHSLPAGFKTAPQPQRFFKAPDADHVQQNTSNVPLEPQTAHKMQAAQALMDRIVQSQDQDQGRSFNSSHSSQSEDEQEQLREEQHGTLPPLYEVTEEDLDPASFDQSQERLPQPMGSPALSDGTVPLPPSPDFSGITGASPTFAHRQHIYPQQQQEQPEDSEVSYADIPPPLSAATKWSNTAEVNLRCSLSSRPPAAHASPKPSQHHGNPSSKASFAHTTHADTRLSSYGSAFSVQTGLTSSTSMGAHQLQAPVQSHPQQMKHSQMTTITPSDIDARQMLAASESNGMIFDQNSHRWVKTSSRQQPSSGQQNPENEDEANAHSHTSDEDPFKSIDSLAEESQTPPGEPPALSPLPILERVSQEAPRETEESTDGRIPLHKLREQTPFVVPGEATLSQDADSPRGENERYQKSLISPQLSDSLSPPAFPHSSSTPTDHRSPSPLTGGNAHNQQHPLQHDFPATPLPVVRAQSAPSAPRSALKNRHSVADATPQAKGMSFSVSNSRASENQTQIRSVSFSDGRTQGKMLDATPMVIPAFKRSGSQPPARSSGLKNEISMASASSGDESSKDLTTQSHEDADETNASNENEEHSDSLHLPLDEITDSEDGHESPVARQTSVPASLRSRATRIRPRADISSSREDPFLNRSSNNSLLSMKGVKPSATFLTECSFGVSHDRLVKLITDVEPYEPNWEGLTSVDLSGKKAESLVRLKEFLPNLDEADLSYNEISYLTGLPSGLRTLLVCQNRLSSVTSFGHLRNLERLDISNNQLESVNQLSCLVHLRELKADNNRISDLSGLSQLDGLVKLSLKGNALQSVDFSNTNWRRLESLNLSENALQEVHGVDHLSSCIFLNLEHNEIVSLTAVKEMPKLRILRISKNPLTTFDAQPFCNLRTLFIDNARLGTLRNLEALGKLENLSVREQQSSRLQLPTKPLRDIRRLYMSGNSLPRSFPSYQYFDIVYLELSACQLITLPENFASLVPNCRYLNLSHNFLEDMRPLAGLSRLRRLSIVGSRLEKSKPVLDVIRTMPELEALDLRLNPLTLSFYAPFLPDRKAVTLNARLDEGVSDWRKADRKHVKTMPDLWYLRRMAYRGAIMQVSPTLRLLDGVKTEEKEHRQKIIDLCQQLELKQGQLGKNNQPAAQSLP